jgi:hypothetical protein
MNKICFGLATMALLFAASAQPADLELCVTFNPTAGAIKEGSLIRLREECKVRLNGTPREISLGKVSRLMELLKPTCSDYGGAEAGGYCWFLGGQGQSCTEVCADMGGTCDDEGATRSYAGSGGTLQNCEGVLTAVGAQPSSMYTSGGNLGCAANETFAQGYWYGSQQPIPSLTTCDAIPAGQLVRACACDLPK